MLSAYCTKNKNERSSLVFIVGMLMNVDEEYIVHLFYIYVNVSVVQNQVAKFPWLEEFEKLCQSFIPKIK